MATRRIRYQLLIGKELIMLILAVMSIGFVVYEFLGNPTAYQLYRIDLADVLIAFIFLIDYAVGVYYAVNRREFVRAHWYTLLAAIPITTSWATALRGFRILGLIRLVRAGEDIDYSLHDVPRA